MAIFRYRMQSILNIKEKMEQQSKENFALAQKRLIEEEEKLETLYRRKEDYEKEGASLRCDKLHPKEILDNRDAIERLSEMCKSQEISVKAAMKDAENAKRLMLEARKETKTQEKLKEHAFEEFIKDENRKESKEVDELTNYRFFHS